MMDRQTIEELVARFANCRPQSPEIYDAISPFFHILFELLPLHQGLAAQRWDEILKQYPDETLKLAAQATCAFSVEAFEELWSRHREWVYNFCLRRLRGRKFAADEVAATVLLKLYRNRTYNPEVGPFRAYLLTICWKTLYGYRPPRDSGGADGLVAPGGTGDDPNPPDDKLQTASEMVHCLPEGLREVMQRSLRGQDDKDIARDLNIDVEGVYRRRDRAKNMLRERGIRDGWFGANRNVVCMLLDQLSTNQQAAIAGRWRGETYATIAAKLKCTESEVASYFFEAIGRVFERLEAWFKPVHWPATKDLVGHWFSARQQAVIRDKARRQQYVEIAGRLKIEKSQAQALYCEAVGQFMCDIENWFEVNREYVAGVLGRFSEEQRVVVRARLQGKDVKTIVIASRQAIEKLVRPLFFEAAEELLSEVERSFEANRSGMAGACHHLSGLERVVVDGKLNGTTYDTIAIENGITESQTRALFCKVVEQLLHKGGEKRIASALRDAEQTAVRSLFFEAIGQLLFEILEWFQTNRTIVRLNCHRLSALHQRVLEGRLAGQTYEDIACTCRIHASQARALFLEGVGWLKAKWKTCA